MVKTSHILWLIVAPAIAATPVTALAQNNAGSSAQEGSPRHGQQGAGQQTGGMQQGQQGSAQQAARPIPINGHFSYPLANGCNYQADVRGTARPARGPATAGPEPLYSPDVTIDASVSCPNQTTIRIKENLSGAGRSMTLTQLEEALELRASLVTETSGTHCAYVPDFRLTRQQLEGVGAALLCPLPAQAARGGGPEQQRPEQRPEQRR